METTHEIEMEQVSSRLFYEHLAKWPMVASVSQAMPMENAKGRYVQTGYFSVIEIVGTTMVPDMNNILGAIRRAPHHSHGSPQMSYFINTNATPEQ